MAYSYREELLLITSIGVISFLVSNFIHKQLILFRDANEIKKPDKDQELVGKEAEDSVQVSTLNTLIQDVTSREVKLAAIKLGVERFDRNPYAWNALLQDVVGDDVQRQESALRALRYLWTIPQSSECVYGIFQKFKSPVTISAVITCLCNFLPSHSSSNAGATNPIPAYRPPPDALFVLNRFVCFDLTTAIRCGLVSRWLKHYPFGDTPAQSIKKAIRSSDSAEGPNENFVSILRILSASPEGKRAMRAAGLVGSSIGEETDEMDDSERPDYIHWETTTTDGTERYPANVVEYATRNGIPVGGIHQATGSNVPRIFPSGRFFTPDDLEHLTPDDLEYLTTRFGPLMRPSLLRTGAERRSRNQRFSRLVQEEHERLQRQHQREQNSNPEQAAVRRRRREAMVFHEGGSPISREDIFQRQMTGDLLGSPEGTEDIALPAGRERGQTDGVER